MAATRRFFAKTLRLPISKRLFIATFCLLLGVLAFMSIASFRMASATIDAQRIETMRSFVNHMDNLLEASQGQINMILLTLASNRDLWRMPRKEVERLLGSYVDAYPLAERLYIIREADGAMIGIPQPIIQALGPFATWQVNTRIGEQTFGVQCTEPYLSNLTNWTVTIGIRVPKGPDGEGGILGMDISLTKLPELLPRLSFANPSAIFVFSPEAEILIADPKNPIAPYSINENRLLVPETLVDQLRRVGDRVERIQFRGESYSILGSKAKNRYLWRTVFISSDALLRNTLDSLVASAFRILLILIAASFVIDWILTRYYAQPLEKLAAEVSRIDVDSYRRTSYMERNDEIGSLARSVNSLMGRIVGLIDELTRTERLKREADIRAIQAQINPHFLFNALNSIGNCASMGKKDEVREMVRALVQILSASLDQTSQKVLFAKELEFINHYVRLLQLSRQDRFTVVYSIAPRTGSAKVPKLILQPLVENAVLHGFRKLDRPGTLTVSTRILQGSRGDLLEIRVEDDGHGPGPARNEGLGLRSVTERLTYYYGEAASFSLEALAAGTASILEIPLEEGEHA